MENVIIENNLDGLMDKARATYHIYIYNKSGSYVINYNDRNYEITNHSCTIIYNTKMLKGLVSQNNVECTAIYVEEGFLRQSQPNNPYMIQGMLALQANPVIELVDNEVELCRQLFFNFQLRVEDKRHKFYDDILRTSTRMLLLDLFDIHSRTLKTDYMSKSSASIMTKFIQMLNQGGYRENREVAYYAEQLCVVPKYLSEVSNKISGYSASYWINRYASHEIKDLLMNQKLPSAKVAEMFHFTSVSYFNRYVKRYLGMYPAELRAQ